VNTAHWVPFIPKNTGTFGQFGWSGIIRAAGVIFFAYIGFDAVSTAAQEARNPQRDMPIGIIGSLVICTILYILYAHVLTGVVNYKDLRVAAPLAVAVDRMHLPVMGEALKVGSLLGLTSVMLVMLLGQSRVFFSMSKDGLLPALFSRVHPRFRTPYLSNTVLLIFVSLFGGFAPIAVVGEMTSIGTLFAFVIVCAGIIVMRKTQPDLPRPFKTPFVPVVPILGILVNFALMAGLGWTNWLRLFVWLILGLTVYVGYSRHHSVARSGVPVDVGSPGAR
jgi:APA family basic amino acid/polyamine antiporter